MGVSDRLYETACDCRDLEESLDRIKRELHEVKEERDAYARGAGELATALYDLEHFGGPLAESRVLKAAAALSELAK